MEPPPKDPRRSRERARRRSYPRCWPLSPTRRLWTPWQPRPAGTNKARQANKLSLVAVCEWELAKQPARQPLGDLPDEQAVEAQRLLVQVFGLRQVDVLVLAAHGQRQVEACGPQGQAPLQDGPPNGAVGPPSRSQRSLQRACRGHAGKGARSLPTKQLLAGLRHARPAGRP